MKVSTRIAAVTLLFTATLVAVLLYHVMQVQRLVAVNESLVSARFQVARTAIDLERSLGQLEEFTLKFAVSRDEGYARGVEEYQATFGNTLDTLLGLPLVGGESTAALALDRLWDFYREDWALFRRSVEEETVGPSRQAMLGHIEALRQQSRLLTQQSSASIEALARESSDQRQEAQRFSIIAAWSAGLLMLPIAWLTVRSIHRPLKRLSEGTQAVAAGEFTPLETSGPQELSQLAYSFNHMVDRLRELDSLKKDFLAHVSHELRTPLVAMKETNEALLDEIPGTLNRQQKRLLELNVGSAQKLNHMISKLLDLARMEAGAMEYNFRSDDLVGVVLDAVRDFTASPDRASRLGLRIEVDSVPVRCDRERLTEVVDNLLANAFKFSPPDTPVRLAIRSSNDGANGPLHPGDHVLLEVTDAGPGVPEPDKPRVFDRFHRVTDSGHPHGFGLGLAICREIVEAHGGRIWVEDNQPQGSRFSVELTVAEGAGLAVADNLASEAKAS